MTHGVDVSHYQRLIDWQKAKADGIQFAICKVMYESSRRPDEYFYQNYAACEQVGIRQGIYIYFASKSIADIEGEAKAVLNILGGRKLPYSIWFDLEDKTIQKLGKAKITALVEKAAPIYEAAGYHVGIYSNKNWYDNVLDHALFAKYPFWCARYPLADKGDVVDRLSPMKYAQAWQYSSKGRVNGITGVVDRDIDFVGLDNYWIKAPKKLLDEVANEVINGLWGTGTDRKNRLAAAGYDYQTVQLRVNNLLKIQR